MFSNRQSFRRGPRASARHHRCTNRSGRSARRRFGRAGFQPRHDPVGSTLQSAGPTRPPFGGPFAEPSDRFAQADPIRHFPVSIFDFPSSAVAFLIRYQQLEFNVNPSKQTPTAISNPQNRRFIFSKKRPKSGPRHPRFSIFKFPFSASPRPFWWLTAHPHFRQTSPPKDLGAPASRCPANSSRPPLHRRMIHCEEPQHD